MSWMDSWSRPKKMGATPPPFYSIPGHENTPYCHSCGRVISSRRSDAAKASSTPAKYCSERCRHSKPGKIDRRIESTFVAILDGADPADISTADPTNNASSSAQQPAPDDDPKAQSRAKEKKKRVKGDPRITVMCADVEALIFGSRYDPEKTHGRKRNKAKRTLGGDNIDDTADDNITAAEEPSDDEGISNASREDESISGDNNQNDSTEGSKTVPHSTTTNSGPTVDPTHKGFGAGKVRPAQVEAEVNFSVGGERGWAEKLEETPEMLARRREGQKRADEREMVRCAARRLCVFGHLVGETAVNHEEQDNADSGRGKKRGKKGGGKTAADIDGKNAAGEQKPVVQEKRKKCEAVMNSMVVEASLAKGEWGIRWREDQDL